MTQSEPVRAALVRHEREIAALRAELSAIKDGHAKKELEDEIAQRIKAIEADIALQELQEQIEKDEAEKQRKRGWFHW